MARHNDIFKKQIIMNPNIKKNTNLKFFQAPYLFFIYPQKVQFRLQLSPVNSFLCTQRLKCHNSSSALVAWYRNFPPCAWSMALPNDLVYDSNQFWVVTSVIFFSNVPFINIKCPWRSVTKVLKHTSIYRIWNDQGILVQQSIDRISKDPMKSLFTGNWKIHS